MVAPDFVKKLRNKVISSDDQQEFVYEVEYVGKPVPKIVWYHNNIVIKNDDNRRIEQLGDYQSKLIIKKILKEDQGEYRARIFSYLGEAISIAEVKMISESKKDISIKLDEEKIIKKVVQIKKRKDSKTDEIENKPEVTSVKELTEIDKLTKSEEKLAETSIDIKKPEKSTIKLKKKSEKIPDPEIQVDNIIQTTEKTEKTEPSLKEHIPSVVEKDETVVEQLEKEETEVALSKNKIIKKSLKKPIEDDSEQSKSEVTRENILNVLADTTIVPEKIEQMLENEQLQKETSSIQSGKKKYVKKKKLSFSKEAVQEISIDTEIVEPSEIQSEVTVVEVVPQSNDNVEAVNEEVLQQEIESTSSKKFIKKIKKQDKPEVPKVEFVAKVKTLPPS